MAKKPKATPTKELQALCVVWQKRLRLQDWKITVNFFEFEENYTYGGCTTTPNFQEANIGVSSKLAADRVQIEQTLVHELIHVTFAQLRPDLCKELDPHTAVGHCFEVGVDMLSRALVEAYK